MDEGLSEAAQRVAADLLRCECGHDWALHRRAREVHPVMETGRCGNGCYALPGNVQKLSSQIGNYCFCQEPRPEWADA